MDDLWVLPPAANSLWFSRIDWYLNWQLCKGLAHQPAAMSVELLRVLESTGVKPEENPRADGAPLMVSSLGRVPAQKCVVLDYGRSLKPWLKKIDELSVGLKPKRMRIFLPSGTDGHEAKKFWKEVSTTDSEVEFSTDGDVNDGSN